jgi:crossover junction endodeoxyribonuclease RuvC
VVIRVLGVDPGLTRCGVGVIDGPSSQPVLVDCACIRTSPDTPIEHRLLAVHDGITALIEQHQPDVLAIERVLFQTNVRTAMATGQAMGVAMLAGARAGLTVVPYSPNDVKLTVTGDGAADKDGVSRMVVAQLRLSQAPKPVDVTDALAVAITHLARHRMAAVAAPRASKQAASAPAGSWEALIAANPHVREAGGA